MEKILFKVRVSCMTYNQASYITDALNGFCCQETSFPYVCTIIDDSSIDGEQQVIMNYLEEHFDMDDETIVRKEETEDYNMFFSRHKTNHNCFFAVLLLKYNHYSINKTKRKYYEEWQVSSKYVAICEGDDYWIDPFKLKKQVEFLDANPEVGLVYTNINMYYTMENRLVESYFSKDNVIQNTHDDFILHAWFIAPCTWMFRKELAERKPNLDPKYYFTGDTLSYLTFSKYSKVHYMDDVTALYRVMKVSASHFDLHDNRRDFWKKISHTRIYFAKDKNISFRLRLWREMVGYQRPSFKRHIDRIPSWLFDSLSLLLALFK